MGYYRAKVVDGLKFDSGSNGDGIREIFYSECKVIKRCHHALACFMGCATKRQGNATECNVVGRRVMNIQPSAFLASHDMPGQLLGGLGCTARQVGWAVEKFE